MKGIGWLSMLPFLTQGKGEDEPSWAGDYGEGIDPEAIRRAVLAGGVDRAKYPFLQESQYAAQGGRIGYQYGGADTAGVISKVPPSRVDQIQGNQLAEDALQKIYIEFRQRFPEADEEDIAQMIRNHVAEVQLEGTEDFMSEDLGILGLDRAVKMITPESVDRSAQAISRHHWQEGGRIGAQEGGLMDLGGMEKDYRQEGGFVPIGGQERADDVPARLSKNEFVFTADAVRAAGGGDIDAGAEVMENVMENLEQGGQVSQDSQGLEGARNMFATAQRLEGVL
jgi:hypothetical protein